MAMRSGWLHEKQVASCRRRAVPEVSTLKTPPGSEDSGSAWDLPEIQAVIADTGSSTVEFNTCAYQTKQKRRWYKPARWTGKLESMASLAKVCKCQPWVQHVPVIGKGNTEAAGAYPPDLTDAIAKKIVEAWKRILNLEWLRYQLQQKFDKVNKLQERWLENEEKRRKRVYVEEEPSNTRPLTGEVKSPRLETKATESHDMEEDNLPSSSTRASKRQRREEMNDFAMGGMRNPAAAVSRLHQVRQVGEMIHAAWMDFVVSQHPEALSVAINYGSSEAKFNEDVLARWTERLQTSLLEMETQDGITLREEMEFKSPLHSSLWDAWRIKARDPEQCIGQWAREGAPGMEREVQDSNIFPGVEPGEALESKTDLIELMGMKNYGR
jgi:hypothetical protein